MQRYQVLDEITLLVDKSLVMADDNSGRTCYRLCETMRHYALEKLSEAGEVDAVFARHRDYYTALAARVDNPGPSDYSHCLDQAETEIDNLRAAFVWNRENSDTEGALALASSLLRVWMTRGRIQEGAPGLTAFLPTRMRVISRWRPRCAPGIGRQGPARHLRRRRRRYGAGPTGFGDRARGR